MNWFFVQSLREQIMIIGALILALIFIGWQFLIQPVYHIYNGAVQNHHLAERDLNTVRYKLALLNQSNPNKNLAPFDRTAFVAIANQTGIMISRVQPNQNGQIQVWFDDVPSQKVFALLKALSSDYAVQITRLRIDRRRDGQVRAEIVFTPTGSPIAQ